jgi:hypothetical protein
MDERQRRNWKPACGCGQAATWSGAGIAIAVEIAKQVIKAYRSKQLLWDLFGHRDGTIAFTTIDGTKVFGSNSTSPVYTSADYAAAVRMRNILVAKYPNKFPDKDIGRIPNDASFHAETMVLLRAAREKGGILADRTLTVYVDGHLCNSCQAVLPYVGLELGNPTVLLLIRMVQRKRCAMALG